MKLTFLLKARLFDPDTGSEISSDELEDIVIPHSNDLDAYLESDLADAGVRGGRTHIIIRDGRCYVEVDFRIPRDLSERLQDELQQFTVAQMDDGIGESGFFLDTGGRTSLVYADTTSVVVRDYVDDGSEPVAPTLAIAARDGDISSLQRELGDPPVRFDVTLQGYTPLQLAILYGHLSAVRLLLKSGADPNDRGVQGMSTMDLGAASNSLNDADSTEVAELLIKAGLQPDAADVREWPAYDIALARDKIQLASYLVRIGGTTRH